MSSQLDARFFRHEYGRLVAMLSRRVGVRHLEAVEDAAQSALLAALESWTKGSVPDNPSAWLYRAAYNHVVGELRRRARRQRLVERHASEATDSTESAPSAFLSGDVRDHLVRMLFVCCDASIPVESQLVIALKTLCGFDVREISERLFTTEANVYKRLGRARSRLRELPFEPDDLTSASEPKGSRAPEATARARLEHCCQGACALTKLASTYSQSAMQREAALDSTFHALADRTRRSMIRALASGEPRSAGELGGQFRSAQPTISRHLKVLESAGLIERRVEGRVHRFRLRRKPLQEAGDWINRHQEFWTGAVDQLDRLLKENE